MCFHRFFLKWFLMDFNWFCNWCFNWLWVLRFFWYFWKCKGVFFSCLWVLSFSESFRFLLFSFPLRLHNLQKNNNNNPSGGQRAGNWPSPALQQHHSGTRRKDTQNINVVGTNIDLRSFVYAFLSFLLVLIDFMSCFYVFIGFS